MTNSQLHLKKPTPRQMRFLRELALSRGQSFAYPTTAAAAHREIERLLAEAKDHAGQRRLEAKDLRADMATLGGGAAAVRREEIKGYGSGATWR